MYLGPDLGSKVVLLLEMLNSFTISILQIPEAPDSSCFFQLGAKKLELTKLDQPLKKMAHFLFVFEVKVGNCC